MAPTMAHFEDYELAQIIHRTLQELRTRKTSATVLELDAIAAQAALPASCHRQESRSYVDEARTDAWLAVSRLAAATAENQTAVNYNEPDKIVDMGALWAVALDRVRAWIDEARGGPPILR
jgi:hypothetical protein